MTDELTQYNSSTHTALSNTILNDIEKSGRELYAVNSVYSSLANVLEHPMMRDFIDRFIDDYDETVVVLMFIKLYISIERKSPVKLSPYQKLALMDSIIHTPELRQQLCCGTRPARRIL